MYFLAMTYIPYWNSVYVLSPLDFCDNKKHFKFVKLCTPLKMVLTNKISELICTIFIIIIHVLLYMFRVFQLCKLASTWSASYIVQVAALIIANFNFASEAKR